ncbi:hypothetical protein RclHR1_07590001 [Rhizophagus clarus]|uniref:Uncharacterized protein n=1 Tax=Rhizophagus clarus TaxID=94130 RepID=A0A2Z6SCN3_9GLOM|nr:hypothetical protein RclHR1_07590001 [Rhizophagus clarus]
MKHLPQPLPYLNSKSPVGTTTVVGGVETLHIGGLGIRCWTPGLRMFLDEPDLGNVAGLLGRTRLGNVSCRPSWTNWTWEYCWTPDLKCCSFPCSS